MCDVDKFYKQHNHYLMVFALVGLAHELKAVHNQILSGSVVPTYDMVSE